MRRITLFIAIILAALPMMVAAQYMLQVTGTVRDVQTRAPMPHVNVVAKGTNIATVTNDDGVFLLKLPEGNMRITFSHMGYESQSVVVRDGQNQPLDIRLKPTTIQLDEVVVWTEDPRELVRIAVSKISDNYSERPERYQTFYREMVQKRKRYISVAEGVVDMYKSAYGRNVYRDGVSIRKGRRIISSRVRDTLGRIGGLQTHHGRTGFS